MKYYRNGWPNGIAVNLRGAKYLAATGVPNLPTLGSVDGNATLKVSKGLLIGPLTFNADIAANDKVKLISPDFTLSLAKATGVITGKFKDDIGKKPAFVGTIYQKGPNAGGFGYFLSVPLPGATGQSGQFSLTHQ